MPKLSGTVEKRIIEEKKQKKRKINQLIESPKLHSTRISSPISFCLLTFNHLHFTFLMLVIPTFLFSPQAFHFYYFLKFLFYFNFLAALGLHCCSWAFSSCGELGLLFVEVHGLLIAVASLVAEHRLSVCGLQ